MLIKFKKKQRHNHRLCACKFQKRKTGGFLISSAQQNILFLRGFPHNIKNNAKDTDTNTSINKQQ